MKLSEVKKIIYLYWTAEFFNNLLFTVPIWVTFQLQFMTFQTMSFLMTIRYIIAFCLELPTGAFADLFGRRMSILTGSIIIGISYFLAAFSRDAFQFTVAMVVMSIGEAFISGANLALLFDSLKHHNAVERFPKVRSTGVFIAQISLVLSSLVSGYLYKLWAGLPYIAESVRPVGVALSYFLMHEYHTKANGLTVKAYIQKTKDGFMELLKTPYIKNLSFYYVFVGAISWTWQQFFNQIYATAIGYTEIQKGWLFGIIRMVNAILLMTVFTRSVFTKPVVFIFLPLVIVITAFLAPVKLLPVGTLLLFSMTLASSLRFSILDGYTNEEFESHHRATALSALNMLVRFLYMIIVIVSGLFLDRYFTGYIYAGTGLLALFTIVPVGIILAKMSRRGHDHTHAPVLPAEAKMPVSDA